MRKSWHEDAWNDYLYWQQQDKKTLKRINTLIQGIERNGYESIGKPEQLKGDLSGWWSMRIDEVNRLVFRITDTTAGADAGTLEILQCRGHYE